MQHDAPPLGQPAATRGQWPPALRAFVDGAFAGCRSDGQRDRIEAHLKERIREAIRTSTLYSTNWAVEVLPPHLVAPPMPPPMPPSMPPQVPPPMPLPMPPQMPPQMWLPPRELPPRQLPPRAPLPRQLPPPAPPLAPPLAPPPRVHEVGAAKKSERALRFTKEAAKEGAARAAAVEHAAARKRALIALAEGGIEWDECTIIGTCERIDKRYLRLTSAPDPRTVRPLPVLRRTLAWLKDECKAQASEGLDAAAAKERYHFICDQLKSLRQDLTVQRIRTDFTVHVYEIHARIALEHGDLGEYNQCQAQLKGLYGEGLPGAVGEFLAYRILYLLHTQNGHEMGALMALVERSDERTNAAVIHALDVRAALALANYERFFELYCQAPNMGAYLMDHFVGRERIAALVVACNAYRPSIPIEDHLVTALAFDSAAECRAFLTTAGLLPDGAAQPPSAAALDARVCARLLATAS